jgi:hypothetical protein
MTIDQRESLGNDNGKRNLQARARSGDVADCALNAEGTIGEDDPAAFEDPLTRTATLAIRSDGDRHGHAALAAFLLWSKNILEMTCAGAGLQM